MAMPTAPMLQILGLDALPAPHCEEARQVLELAGALAPLQKYGNICPEAASTPYSHGQSRAESPDDEWMRMRTPSPENVHVAYRRAAPLPPQLLLSLALDLSPSSRAAWKPMDCSTAFGRRDSVASETTAASSPRPSSVSSPASDDVSAEFMCAPCEPGTPKSSFSDKDDEPVPSKGSIGHPFSCAAPCKYVKKARGCKDGADCVRCHLCAFRNVKQPGSPTAVQKSETESLLAPPVPPAPLAPEPLRAQQQRRSKPKRGQQR